MKTSPCRSPEQNTKPKVYYKGADQASLDPTRTMIKPDGMIWADTTANHRLTPQLDAHGHGDPGIVARTAYTTSHKTTWDMMVSGYLVTKAIAGGIMMMAALMIVLGHADEQAAVGVVPPIVAGVFLAVTGVLLVGDLKQPKRFYYLLTKSNFDSWLVKGAYVLSGVRRDCQRCGSSSELPTHRRALQVVAIPTAMLGAATAGYTAFLFAQCEGRDLWQTPLLLPLLLARAVTAGASAYAILDMFMDIPSHRAVWWTLLGGVAAVAFLSWVELQSHGSRHVEMAVARHDQGWPEGAASRVAWSFGMLLPALLVIIAFSADVDTSIVVAVLAAVSHSSACSCPRPPSSAPANPSHSHDVTRGAGHNSYNARRTSMTDLQKYPPHDQWHDWTELDAKAWPDKVERNYTLVPTTCFNCEAACGLVAYFDNETGEIAKIEGNPEHPRQPWPQLCQGSGDAEPDLRQRADHVPAQADGRTRERAGGSGSAGTRPSARSAIASAQRSRRTATTR